jgi:LysR family glycine cleavage system transcriptional activator
MLHTKQQLPLNALRAFEAVGRHLHMRHAAEELCVTHSAVSQQVRKLEDLLGVALLQRRNTGLALTPAGGRLLRDVSAGLDGLVRATERVSLDAAVAELRVACSAGLASNWLLPKLDDFLAGYPKYEFKLDPIRVFPHDIPGDVDLAITYGKPPVSDDRVTRLAKSPLLPVASPDLVHALGGAVVSLDKLRDQTLIHADDGAEWRLWFRQVGLEGTRASRNLYLSAGYHMIVDAVRRGVGVGLLARRFIENDLAAGRVRIVHHGAQLEPEHYYVVRPEETYRSAAARALESWIYAQWNLCHDGAEAE